MRRVPDGELMLERLELGDLDSVPAVRGDPCGGARAPVGVLVNNAGIGMPARSLISAHAFVQNLRRG